jgi:hypothetical protein
MSETTQASESSRVARAIREFIDADGNKVEDKMDAKGARYTLRSNGKSITRMFNGDAQTNACAAMGWLTKIGNVVNTVVNGPDQGSDDDAYDAAVEWDNQLTNGIWREKVEGVGVARIDKDALARAVVEVKPQDYDKVREKLETEPAYVRKVRQHPKVLELYNQYTGKAKVSDDDLAA